MYVRVYTADDSFSLLLTTTTHVLAQKKRQQQERPVGVACSAEPANSSPKAARSSQYWKTCSKALLYSTGDSSNTPLA